MTDDPAKPRRNRDPRPGGERRTGDTRRAFVAVFPSEAVGEGLAALRRRLEPALPGLRWVAPGNLHFTLRFFGDLTGPEIERAREVLDRTAAAALPFPLVLTGLGVFPGWRRPRVLWVGVGKGGERLEALARVIERGFREARLGKADKPFVPHLTLGRWRESRGLDIDAARAACEGMEWEAGLTVEQVQLTASELAPGGSVYTPLHVAALGAR